MHAKFGVSMHRHIWWITRGWGRTGIETGGDRETHRERVFVCVWLYVCVCVCKREREKAGVSRVKGNQVAGIKERHR